MTESYGSEKHLYHIPHQAIVKQLRLKNSNNMNYDVKVNSQTHNT